MLGLQYATPTFAFIPELCWLVSKQLGTLLFFYFFLAHSSKLYRRLCVLRYSPNRNAFSRWSPPKQHFVLNAPRCVHTISFDTGPVWFHRRQPPPSEGPSVSEALVSDRKLLSLLSPVYACDASVRTAVGVNPFLESSVDY